jgi:F-type H+-transporting ATPase subunit epsilon
MASPASTSAANKLHLELVTPMKRIAARDVTMVTLPAAAGTVSILPQHCPMISPLTAGVVEIYDQDKIADRFFISGGFLEVNTTGCTALVQDATPVGQLVRAEVEAEIQALSLSLLKLDGDEPQRETLIHKLNIATAKVEAAGN